MNSIIDYRGHIRNWKQLCEELGIADSLAREEREREIVLKAYEKWGMMLPTTSTECLHLR